MKKIFLLISGACMVLLIFISWSPRFFLHVTYEAEDSAQIAKGEALFNQNCSGCHNFRQDGIGPQLGGLTTKVSSVWIERFIKNPQKMISSGDKRAQQQFKKFKVIMPSFPGLKPDELKSIVAFLNTRKQPIQQVSKTVGKEATNPIPEAIKTSGLVGGLELFTTIPPSSDSGKLPLTRIITLDYQPATKESFVLDQRGKLYKLNDNKPGIYMNIAELRPKFIPVPGLATGFGSFAFHPDFAKNGLLYTTHTEPAGTAKADFAYADSIKVTLQWVLTEWKADDPTAATFSGKGRELFRVNMVTGIHGVQQITFNPRSKPGDDDYGLLYIGVGEGGAVESGYPFLAHNLHNVWGTVLRIEPTGNNSANKQYGIPKHNPFAENKDPKILKEIYAYGFRNPNHITWSSTGQMLVSNVGHGNIESLDLITPGADYGWPIREGTFVVDPYGNLNKVFQLPANDNIYKITYPVAEFDHDEGKAISGGYEYTGTAVPQLKGKFLFGDIPSGRLFYVEMADIKRGKQAPIKEWKMSINGKQTSFKDIIGKGRIDLHFGRDANGELYLLTKADGKVYKLVSAEITTPNVATQAKL
jgi:glucose/arabinose dehydrogenase/cytochrome c2